MLQQLHLTIAELLTRKKRFVGTLIAFIVSAIVTATTAAAAGLALQKSVQTAEHVNRVLVNISQDLEQQTAIDQQIMTQLQALEASVLWLGERQDALIKQGLLTCDLQFSRLCITNLTVTNDTWIEEERLLKTAVNTNLATNIRKLRQKVKTELLNLLIQTRKDSADYIWHQFQWLNPKTWFTGILPSNWFLFVVLIMILIVGKLLTGMCSWFSFQKQNRGNMW